jgi:hypothetical protein
MSSTVQLSLQEKAIIGSSCGPWQNPSTWNAASVVEKHVLADMTSGITTMCSVCSSFFATPLPQHAIPCFVH